VALIAIASVKGAPGVTTTALSLAATWPRRVMLAELDPDGGVLVHRLPGADGGPPQESPGLLTYADGVLNGADALDHVQTLPGGLGVLFGPPSAAAARQVADRWGAIGALLDVVPGADVIADCGRLHVDAPIDALLARASALLVLTRPTLDAVAHLRARLLDRPVGPPTWVAVITGPNDRRSLREVQAVLTRAELPVPVLGRVAFDPAGVGTLGAEWTGTLSNSALMRSVRELGHRLSGLVETRGVVHQ
jgi:cellulose biosynthesis protein BcsQ